jgi:hypothetical protein
MATDSKPIQDWYANQLHGFYLASYRAFLARNAGESDVASSPESELGPSAVQIPREEVAKLPARVREAYEFYWQHFEDADIGSARVYRVTASRKQTYAVHVRTDGDDGWLEVYDAKGGWLAGGRTYLEVVAWGSRDWLRAQVAEPGTLPPELADAGDRTLWGKPLPD